MKLRDIGDMERYLAEDCYCPGEIYDMSGFFFRVYHPEDECTALYEGEKGAIHGLFVLVDNQIVYIEKTAGKVDSCVRIDATEHNYQEIGKFMRGEIDKMNFDEFHDGETAHELEKIMNIADAVMLV